MGEGKERAAQLDTLPPPPLPALETPELVDRLGEWCLWPSHPARRPPCGTIAPRSVFVPPSACSRFLTKPTVRCKGYPSRPHCPHLRALRPAARRFDLLSPGLVLALRPLTPSRGSCRVTQLRWPPCSLCPLDALSTTLSVRCSAVSIDYCVPLRPVLSLSSLVASRHGT